MTIQLTLGCKAYPWIEPLIGGDVEPTGVDLTVVDDYRNPEYYSRMLDHGEFDIAELSLGAYPASLAHNKDYEVTAIPVFPLRRFRHSFLYTQSAAEYEKASDLNGCRVGMINWQFTGGIWMRGILQERHGVDLESIKWKLALSEYVSLDIPDRYEVSHLSAESNRCSPIERLERDLAAGELDAVITPTEFHDESVERLFSNPFEMERDYFRDTGIFPIHHVIVIRDSVIENFPWAPNTVYEAFVDALSVWMENLSRRRWSKCSSLVWGQEALEQQFNIFDGNPWEYGLTGRNRRNLSKLLQYATDQSVISENYGFDDLFLSNVGIGE